MQCEHEVAFARVYTIPRRWPLLILMSIQPTYATGFFDTSLLTVTSILQVSETSCMLAEHTIPIKLKR